MGASNSSQHNHDHHHSTKHGSISSTTGHVPNCEVLRAAKSWSSLTQDGGEFSLCQSTLPTRGESGKKKRNLTGFATLKKRLVRRARRASKSFDHGQVLRDFLSNWSTRDLLQLVEEYEMTGLMKELTFQAEIARPSVSLVAQDLSELYDYKTVADTYLIFRGVNFPVHKAIVCVRCPFFRELLGKINTFGARIPVNLEVPGLRPELFNDLLRYLYSGELLPSMNLNSTDLNSCDASSYDSILLRLSEQFGVPNDLDRDMRHLLETGIYSDASLVFSPGSGLNEIPSTSGSNSSGSVKKCRACSDQSEFSCHSSVLASRCPFFKNVIQRHQRRFAALPPSEQINTANQKIRIVLDESIIPRRFARIILHAMYRDSTDIMTVLPHCVCKCSQLETALGSLPGVQGCTNAVGCSNVVGAVGGSSNTTSGLGSTGPSTSSSLASFASMSFSIGSNSGSLSTSGSSGLGATTSGPTSYVKEVMELFEIARFLELDSLIQACEDMIIDSLSVETLVTILKWSEEGSPWVKRQAYHFLREEFTTISTSPVLFQLESPQLLQVVKSDYLQASELELLSAVIKWGENRLLRRMEEREPNVVSQTAHSLRRGVRKRDLNDTELRDIICELMGHIRIGHILPLDSEVVASAAKRSLIATLPPYMLGEDDGNPVPVRGITSWLRGKSSGPFLPPRYFSPYVEEAKSYLSERLRRPGESGARRDLNRAITQIPDTLYMVDKSPTEMYQISPSNHDLYNSLSSSPLPSFPNGANQTATRETPLSQGSELTAIRQISQLPVIEQRILVLMKQREQELKNTAVATLSLLANSSDITKLIQLRVVREFGLPDIATEVLHNTASYVPYPATETTETATDDQMTNTYGIVGMVPSSGVLSNLGSNYGIVGMVPSSGVLSNLGSNGALAALSDKDNIYCCPSELPVDTVASDSPIPPPLPPIDTSYLNQYAFDEEFLGGRHANHHPTIVMPDIAMATSALSDMHLFSKRSTESLARQPPPPQRPLSRTFDSSRSSSIHFLP